MSYLHYPPVQDPAPNIHDAIKAACRANLFCKDCRHSYGSGGDALCYHPKLGVSPVTGGVQGTQCLACRQEPTNCGLEGKWFERQSIIAKNLHYFIAALLIIPALIMIYRWPS